MVHDDRTKRWLVSLHNNLGWTLHQAGRFTEAMVEFQLAEQWADRVGTPSSRNGPGKQSRNASIH